eukprot:701788-Rhodomonas_salina.2
MESGSEEEDEDLLTPLDSETYLRHKRIKEVHFVLPPPPVVVAVASSLRRRRCRRRGLAGSVLNWLSEEEEEEEEGEGRGPA